MYRLTKELCSTKTYLYSIIDKTEQYLLNAPKENLRITSDKSKRKYYIYSDEIKEKKRNGQYLQKKQWDVAISIAMRDYASELKKAASRIICKIDELQTVIESFNPENVYFELKDYRKELVTPLVLDRSMTIERWKNQPYKRKTFAEGTAEIYSERGERVRSKSEKIIADFLLKNNVPYLYEKPIQLLTKGHSTLIVYPDFTILDTKNKKEIYLEHFGKMDDAEYVQKTVKKINSYARSGIFLGDKLLITFETAACPFDSRLLENILRNANILNEE